MGIRGGFLWVLRPTMKSNSNANRVPSGALAGWQYRDKPRSEQTKAPSTGRLHPSAGVALEAMGLAGQATAQREQLYIEALGDDAP
jgi:hypothetical protein